MPDLTARAPQVVTEAAAMSAADGTVIAFDAANVYKGMLLLLPSTCPLTSSITYIIVPLFFLLLFSSYSLFTPSSPPHHDYGMQNLTKHQMPPPKANRSPPHILRAEQTERKKEG